MKKYTDLAGLLTAIKQLPEVRALVANHPFADIIQVKFPDALAQAFTAWYEARTYKVLCPEGEDNAYPGDRAAFSIALKSAFFQFRYAWPKTTIDRALEAIARTLPDTEEVDSYEEFSPAVESMKRRAQIADLKVDIDNLPEGPGRDLLSALRGLREVVQGSSGENSDELVQRLGNTRSRGPTPGCNCPACQAKRKLLPEDGAEAPEGLSPTEDAGSMPSALRRLLESMGSQTPPSPREQIIQQAEDIRTAIKEGTLQNTIDATLSMMPPNMRAANIQAGLTVITELGFGDIVDPYVAAVRTNGKFPDFTAVPISGTPEEEHYHTVLRRTREQINA